MHLEGYLPTNHEVQSTLMHCYTLVSLTVKCTYENAGQQCVSCNQQQCIAAGGALEDGTRSRWYNIVANDASGASNSDTLLQNGAFELVRGELSFDAGPDGKPRRFEGTGCLKIELNTCT